MREREIGTECVCVCESERARERERERERKRPVVRFRDAGPPPRIVVNQLPATRPPRGSLATLKAEAVRFTRLPKLPRVRSVRFLTFKISSGGPVRPFSRIKCMYRAETAHPDSNQQAPGTAFSAQRSRQVESGSRALHTPPSTAVGQARNLTATKFDLTFDKNSQGRNLTRMATRRAVCTQCRARVVLTPTARPRERR